MALESPAAPLARERADGPELTARASRRRTRLGGAVALALAASTLAPASEAPPPGQADDARAAYLGAAQRWAAGDDGVIELWAGWSGDELARLYDHAPELAAGAPRPLLHDAVRLHVLAACVAARHGRPLARRSHFDLAEAVLAQIPPPAAGEPGADTAGWRRDVALARGYDLLRRWRPSFALEAFKRALEVDPAYGDALLAAGMAEELRVTLPALALDRYVSSPELVNRGAIDDLLPAPGVQRMDRENSLRAAERFFRRAYAADPALAEARVRLGRVLEAERRNSEAEREWRGALAGAHGDAARRPGLRRAERGGGGRRCRRPSSCARPTRASARPKCSAGRAAAGSPRSACRRGSRTWRARRAGACGRRPSARTSNARSWRCWPTPAAATCCVTNPATRRPAGTRWRCG